MRLTEPGFPAPRTTSMNRSLNSPHPLPLKASAFLPSPQEMKARLPRNLSALQMFLHRQLQSTAQVTFARGYRMIRHLDVQPRAREFEIPAAWSRAASESQVLGQERCLQTGRARPKRFKIDSAY